MSPLAGIGHEMATATRLMVDHDLAASVTDAYGRVLVAAGARQSADAAVATALADRELAGNRRDAGLVTDADVLQIDVHVSRTREQQIRAASDERIARAQLNQVMGEPLGEVFVLEPAPAVAAIDATRSRGTRSGGAQEPTRCDARGSPGAASPARVRRRPARRSFRRCRRRAAGNSTAARGTAARRAGSSVPSHA